MIKPEFKTKTKKKDEGTGIFILEPLTRGYGHTLGNALRRCLLTSIKGRSIVAVKIDGIKHQFSTLEGLKEDIIEFILNLKQVVVKGKTDEPVVLKLSQKGPKKVTAKDIKTPADITIVNKDLVLANLANTKSKLECELHSEVGFGNMLADERTSSTIGVIPLDVSFGPVVQVNYKIETARVGRKTDYDRLVLEIKTDGSVDPEEALLQAAETLTSYFKQVYNPVFEKTDEDEKPVIEENAEILDLTVEELDLPTRIANALRRGGYSTVRALVKAKYEDVSKVKNLGGKSLTIIKEKLKAKEIDVFPKE